MFLLSLEWRNLLEPLSMSVSLLGKFPLISCLGHTTGSERIALLSKGKSHLRQLSLELSLLGGLPFIPVQVTSVNFLDFAPCPVTLVTKINGEREFS